ncbi:MAG: bifunctional DNA primase/polymerase [Sphingomonas sp.]|nr:bifunctional DNA primase/polymerase [Sphingomonas sp.]
MATSSPTGTGGFAAEYVRHGFALCAIPLGRKGPIMTGWNLPEKAITDTVVASKLTENVGLLHASCGTMALDVDDDVQAREWLLARGVSPREIISSRDHVGITSGRKGRGKLIYRLPDDVGPIQTLQVKGVAGGVILEFRCADAGGNSVQDVLPPSIHPDTGQPYRWGGPGDWRNPPVIPHALLNVWRDELARKFKGNLPPPPQLQSINQCADLHTDTPENRAELARLLLATVGGQRVFDPHAGHDGWLRDLWSIAALGPWAKDAAREWSKEGGTFDPQKFEEDWASFDPSRAGGITEATFFAKLRDAGVQHSLVKRAGSLSGIVPVSPVPVPTAVLPALAGIMSLPRQLSGAPAVQEINKHFGFAHDWGGKSTHFRVDGAGRVHPSSPQEVKEALASRSIANADGRRRPAYPIWNSSPDRREVAEVRFDPAGSVTTASGQPMLNLWRGFSRDARRGRCKRMLRHLRDVVCSRNGEHFRYLLAWMAHLVQRPWEAPGVVVVLRSPAEGSGKSLVGVWLAEMLGDHALVMAEPTQLLGRFNAHLETRCLVVLNELHWAGDKDAASKFKSIVTDPYLTVERKHGGVYSVPNILHIMAATNAKWAVPAGHGARRWFVLDVGHTRMGDHAYFNALYREADNGGIEALMYILQRFKLDGLNLRAFPVTEALREQQELSLPLEAQWALDLADRGCLWFNGTVESRQLYDDYTGYAQARRVRPVSSNALGRYLTRLELPLDHASTGGRRAMPSADAFAMTVRKDAGVYA